MFDEDYYIRLWGSVHRHDYTTGLADQLIQKYGHVSFLDIGTGCGHLVKVLRERGCKAWGLEISDHALANTCSEFVRKGDVRNIPFASNRFDVVHSQGVFGYFEEVQQAIAECKRVGKHQEHNIDTSDNGPMGQDDGYVIWQSRKWWLDQFYPPVLVACPIHKCKEYSFARWIERVKQLTYPNIEVFVVDNSAEPITGYDVPMQWVGGDQVHAMLRITKSMEVIRQKFLSGNYAWWFNLECDVIPPVDVIEQLLRYEGDWISHSYPMRGNQTDDQQGIGCCLLSRQMMQDFNFDNAGDNSPDGWLWQQVRPSKKYKVMELWSYMDVKHLAE